MLEFKDMFGSWKMLEKKIKGKKEEKKKSKVMNIKFMFIYKT